MSQNLGRWGYTLGLAVLVCAASYWFLQENEVSSVAKPMALQQLILDSNGKFSGSRILVHGYLAEKDGARSLYSSREIASISLVNDGLYITPTQWEILSDCVNRYVSLKGVYGHDGQGILGIISVDSISQVDGESSAIIPCTKNAH